MKIKKENNLIEYVQDLLNRNEMNLSISDILSTIFGNREITSKKEVDLLAERFNCSEKEVFFSKISDYLDIDLEIEDNEEIFNKYVLGSIHELDTKKYLENPYCKAINNLHIKDGNYELVTDHYEPYELFAYQDMSSENYMEINSLGYFKEKFSFIALNYKGVTWMNITPNEIETMDKAVKEAKGDVLVFGLGLGYFPFMALLTPEVKSVTIIENDKKIIELFNKHLKPHFPHQEKLNIILDDANNYLTIDYQADYVFVDLWHNPEDGIDFYLKFKKSESKHKESKFFYWLESSFYLFLRRCMFALIAEQMEKDDPSMYQKAESIEDKIINTYYRKTKNLLVSNKEDLDNLLTETSLLIFVLDDR